MRKIGLLGGTFDPVHIGHLRPALEILDSLALEHLRFIPAGCPPHRAAPVASAAQRLALLKAALADQPRLVLDEREINRTTPCYTVETLADLRGDFPDAALCLIVGMDAFLGFPTWHQWQRLFELAHVVVAHRPGWTYQGEGELAAVLQARRAGSVQDLDRSRAGRIWFEPVTQLEISATQIRELLAAGRDPRYLVPEAVRDLLRVSGWYASSREQDESGTTV